MTDREIQREKTRKARKRAKAASAARRKRIESTAAIRRRKLECERENALDRKNARREKDNRDRDILRACLIRDGVATSVIADVAAYCHVDIKTVYRVLAKHEYRAMTPSERRNCAPEPIPPGSHRSARLTRQIAASPRVLTPAQQAKAEFVAQQRAAEQEWQARRAEQRAARQAKRAAKTNHSEEK